MVGIRTSRLGLLWWEEVGNAVPALIRQLEFVRLEPLDRGRPERWWLTPCPPSAVTDLGDRLVAATKRRPSQPHAAALGWFGDGEEQSSDLGDGQGQEVCWPPFSPAVASRRVTSR